ncbi:MAG: hypothetical protein KF760_30455 [Candidatus Eremiobacteraeota bacterium]|nr:hypothetical protein [Candidatus Eremiobacteraeota bacterium]MCW5868097.1 hypothetical protein [Candidatus Eremiobacteraeota bacterium]
MEVLKRKVLPILLAWLCGAALVAAVLAGKLPWLVIAPLVLAAPTWRRLRPHSAGSLFADGLLMLLGLSISCLAVFGLGFLAGQEGPAGRCFDLARLEQFSQPLPDFHKFQLCGSVYFSAQEKVHTRDYGWVQPIYSRRHPRFPGNHGPDQPPSFFLTLDHDPLERLAHRFLPPAPLDGIRDNVYVRQIHTGFLQEQPGDLLVLPCLERAQALALGGGALFALSLSLLVANLGRQHRARYQISRWDREFGP